MSRYLNVQHPSPSLEGAEQTVWTSIYIWFSQQKARTWTKLNSDPQSLKHGTRFGSRSHRLLSQNINPKNRAVWRKATGVEIRTVNSSALSTTSNSSDHPPFSEPQPPRQRLEQVVCCPGGPRVPFSLSFELPQCLEHPGRNRARKSNWSLDEARILRLNKQANKRCIWISRPRSRS